MRRGMWLMLWLAGGCAEEPVLEPVYVLDDHSVDDVRVPANSDFFAAAGLGSVGRDPVRGSACLAMADGEHRGSGVIGSEVSVQDTVRLRDRDGGPARVWALCTNGDTAEARNITGSYSSGFMMFVGSEPLVALRGWNGSGLVTLGQDGLLRWWTGDVDTVDSGPPLAARLPGCTVAAGGIVTDDGEPSAPWEIADFRVIDDAGTVLAVGPSGLVLMGPDGPAQCTSAVTGTQLEWDAVSGLAYVRDGDTFAAVEPEGTVEWTEVVPHVVRFGHAGALGAMALTIDDGILPTLELVEPAGRFVLSTLPAGTLGARFAPEGTKMVSWEADRVVTWKVR